MSFVVGRKFIYIVYFMFSFCNLYMYINLHMCIRFSKAISNWVASSVIKIMYAVLAVFFGPSNTFLESLLCSMAFHSPKMFFFGNIIFTQTGVSRERRHL